MALVASLLAGCQPRTAASPTPAVSPSATPAAAPTPTTPPAAAPTPTSSAVACPSELPTDLSSVTELADPACYGTTELTIDGWLSEIDLHVDSGEWTPTWTMATSGLFARTPTVGEYLFDFLMTDSGARPFISVVTAASAIDLSGIGRWVALRGRFNDPAASACEVLNWAPEPEDANQDPPDLPCEQLFVVTSLEATGGPVPDCPTESPMTLATFRATDATCFLGREVQISGWEDVGEGFGGASTVMPISLGDLRLADAQLVAHRWESDLGQFPIFPMTVAGSGVTFDRSDRKVIVTGMFGHEAAASCRTDWHAWTWAPPDSWAQHRCMRLFVIDEVRNRS